jgi:hypothetical protein
MGDARTYENVCALRAVTSVDGMTADFFHFDMAFLGRVANRIVNQGARHQPGHLRRHLQAARHDRVGLKRKRQQCRLYLLPGPCMHSVQNMQETPDDGYDHIALLSRCENQG